MNTDRDTPPTQWQDGAVEIDADAGIYLSPSVAFTATEEDNPTFWHWCPKAPFGPLWTAMDTSAHTALNRDPWTLDGDLICGDCGLHGYITEGRWTDAPTTTS